MDTYSVIYEGLAPDTDTATAEANFAKLFKITPEKATTILGKRGVSLRSKLDQPTAAKYQQHLARIGIQTRLRVTPAPAPAALALEPQDQGYLARKQQEELAEEQRAAAVRQEEATPRDLNFEFHGTGPEYFRIWIVNVLLMIVTFGIYSAWAKVRTQQYFHGNTELDGASFQYLATPQQILRGRMLAGLIFIAYALASKVTGIIHVISGIGLVLAMPALLVLSMAFRMGYSSWRNIRFGFKRNFVEAYKLLLIPVVLLGVIYLSMSFAGIEPGKHVDAKNFDWHNLIPFGLGMLIFLASLPWMECLFNKLLVNHAIYGQHTFQFHSSIRDYYKMYIRYFGMMILGIAIVVASITASSKTGGSKIGALAVFLIFPIIMYATAYLQACRFNLRYDGMTIGAHRFSSTLTARGMLGLYLVNTLAIVCSLGLMAPWAKVRTVKYRLSCLTLHAAGNLDEFVGMNQQSSATSEELANMFDMDIAL